MVSVEKISVNSCGIYRVSFLKRGAYSPFLLSRRRAVCGFFGLVIAVSAAIFPASCSPLKFGGSVKAWQSPAALLESYNGHFSRLRTFQADGILQIESPQFNERVPVHIIIKYPDSLRVRLEGPLGVDYAHFFLDAEKYLIYLPRAQETFAGDLATLDVRQLLHDLGVPGLALEDSSLQTEGIHREAMGFFLGGLPLDVNSLAAVNFADSAQKMHLFKTRDSMPETFFEFPLNSADLQRVSFFNEDGGVQVEKSYRYYRNARRVRLPRQIRCTFRQEKSRISIKYTHTKINAALKSGDFHIDIPIKG